MIELRCATETDTRAAAGRLASLCRPGDVIALCGPLGVGKTAFVGGLADGLGVEEAVTSPSFVLMRLYDTGFLRLVHVDAYRLRSIGEFDDLGVFEEGTDGVIVIEWGDAVIPALPDDHLRVKMVAEDDGTRVIGLHPSGIWKTRPLDEVAG